MSIKYLDSTEVQTQIIERFDNVSNINIVSDKREILNWLTRDPARCGACAINGTDLFVLRALSRECGTQVWVTKKTDAEKVLKENKTLIHETYRKLF